MYKFIILSFMVGALMQGFGSTLDFIQGSKNNSDAIYAQSVENEKNRKYNLQLAKLQNEWNLQQWERSNEYNNPLNQMIRLKEGKLNPNLVYGNGAGQSVSVPNPQMTSGSPSIPQDMSLISQRPTIGQIMTQSLQNRLLEAQIKNVDSSSRKNNAEAGITEIEERCLSAIEQIRGSSIDSAELPSSWTNNPIIASRLAEFETAISNAKTASHTANIQGHQEFITELNREFARSKIEKEVEILSHELEIKKDEAEFIAKTLISRINGVTYDTDLKKYEALLNSPELIEKLPKGIKPLVSLLNLVFRGH